MRYHMGFVSWVAGALMLATPAAADVQQACLNEGSMTFSQCSCYADLATGTLSDIDLYYVEIMFQPDGPRTVLDDLAGDTREFMSRYTAFSDTVKTTCFAGQ
ncbi:MAG: hypothetical protein AAGJ96_11730 [Pseudomonadota bacterium]